MIAKNEFLLYTIGMEWSELTPDDYRRAVELCGLTSTKSISRTSGFYHCPRHKDKTPSLSVSFTRGTFHCFSCHYAGSINKLCQDKYSQNIFQVLGYDDDFKLTKSHRGFTKVDFVEELPDENKINIDIRGVLLPFEHSIEAKNYLISRGISFDIARSLNVQYTSDSFINGLRFRNRLMIPIYGESGKLVNMEGRDISRLLKAKVLYPRNSIKPIFDINNLDKTKPLYIVEGLIDLMLLRSDFYFKNSSVMFGSAVSAYQINMLKHFPEIIIIPNNDIAGNTSVINLKDSMKEFKVPVSVLKIRELAIKDVGEVFEKLHTSVEDFRNKGGFKAISNNSFALA